MTAENFLYVQTVASRLKVSERTIYRLIQEGNLAAIRINGRSLRIPTSAYEGFLKKCEIDLDAANAAEDF